MEAHDWQARIEAKIDKLADAVVQLARMEERMITLFTRMDKYEERQEKLEDKVEGIASDLQNSDSKVRFAERVFWIVITAAVSTIFWIFK
jgi:chromosome segregation ATPase